MKQEIKSNKNALKMLTSNQWMQMSECFQHTFKQEPKWCKREIKQSLFNQFLKMNKKKMVSKFGCSKQENLQPKRRNFKEDKKAQY